jgi:hypothetical protein
MTIETTAPDGILFTALSRDDYRNRPAITQWEDPRSGQLDGNLILVAAKRRQPAEQEPGPRLPYRDE